jgi:hypothetical protein
MSSQVYDNVFRTSVICIDSYKDRVLNGRINNEYYNEGVAFHSVMEFLLSMEYVLEEMNWAQSFSGKRVFQSSSERIAPKLSSEHIKEGKLATFSLRILFRQNASWQGTLYWHEKKQGESFRSVLELLTLMDSALSSEQ